MKDTPLDEILEIEKFNPYHDSKGRFASADTATSFTYAPGKSKAHDLAIQREKEKHSASDSSKAEKLDKPVMFNQSGQRVKVTELTEKDGERSCKAQSMKPGQDWKEITDPKRLKGIRDTVDGMKKYEGKTTEELQSEYKRLKAVSDNAYQQTTQAAASRTGSLVSTFASADAEMRQIKAVLDNRRLTVGKSSVGIDKIEEVEKFNPYHDAKGRFTTSGAATSFTYSPGKSKAHDNAIAREKDRIAGIMPTEAQDKALRSIENRTRNLKKEQLRVVDRDGNVIMQKQGGKHSVEFTRGEARDNFGGNVVIHNHPDGGTFSTPDLTSFGYGSTEIRAAAPEGTYTLRNLSYGSKWNSNQKSWVDMQEDLNTASEKFKSSIELKKELRKPYDEKLQPYVKEWEALRASGAPIEEQKAIANEYTKAWDSLKPQLEAEVRAAYVGQYDSWYKSNAGSYGFEYTFTPTRSRTAKGDMMIDINEIEKSAGDIVLDQQMQDDIEEIMANILSEYSRELPITKSAPDIDEIEEIEKFNPYHDSKGRFSTANGATSFTRWTRDPSKQHWAENAISRENLRINGPEPQDTPQRQQILKVEDEIRHQAYESAAIIGKNGAVAVYKDGAADRVEFTPQEGVLMQGRTLTHNHPNSTVLSGEDVRCFVMNDMDEIRATNRNGVTYTLKRADGYTTKKGVQFMNAYEQEWDVAKKTAQRQLDNSGFIDKIMNHEITIDQANVEFRKVINRMLEDWGAGNAPKYGMIYSIEKRAVGKGYDEMELTIKSVGDGEGIVLDRDTENSINAAFNEWLEGHNIKKGEEPMNENQDSFSIFKTDDDKRLVFGWASVSITVDGEQLEDRQKDLIDPEDLEAAAYEYVLHFRDTGEEHNANKRKKGKLVESCVFTVEKQKAIGIPEGILPVGWWIGFKIEDDEAWEKVKNGTYRMFSIEGKAHREPVE